MFREMSVTLEKWKDSGRRKPLLLSGVRQCGKTYLLQRFAEEHFQSFVYINFESSERYAALFDYDFDVNRILTEIERLAKVRITPGETLLIFDEIQECQRAVTALKYFCENQRRLHIVCAGSLLGVAVKRGSLSFPVGKVNRMELRPMNFKEFVTACGQGALLETFRKWPADRVIPDIYDMPMKQLLKDYYIVGGMPEAVQTWIETHDYDAVEAVHREILSDYADDFAKHAPLSELPKIRWIWDSVPVQLAKENNKFVFSHVRAGKRSADLENALLWLIDSGLVTILELTEKPEIPLSAFADKTFFKVYLSDIGLLRTRSGLSAAAILEERPEYGRYKGAFAENYVLNELRSLGKHAYFWRSGNTAEVDFLFEENGQLIPVEVKSADNTQAKSYKLFCNRYRPQRGYKFSMKNIAENTAGGTRTWSLPLYLVWNTGAYV